MALSGGPYPLDLMLRDSSALLCKYNSQTGDEASALQD